MTNTTPLPKPEIFSVKPSDEAVVMSAKRLQNAMYRDPDSYVEALTEVRDTPKVRRAASLIGSLFENQHIQWMSFDDDSETYIAGDVRHQALVKEQNSSNSREDREAKRREMMENRFALFAGRISLWQEMTGNLPNSHRARPARQPKLRPAV